MGGLERVEGRRPVREALRSGRARRVWLAEGAHGRSAEEILAAAAAAGVPVERLPREELDRRSPTGHHQGVMAEARPLAYAGLDDLLQRARERGEPPLILVCAEIQDPQNLGALIRVAEAAGAHGAVVPRHRSAGLTPAVARASAGAVEHLPVARVTNLARAVGELQEAGVWVCALDAEAARPLYELDLTGPLAIVVGSEGRGIPRLVRERCDLAAAIPMFGRVESLNAATAAAVALFEAARQRLARRAEADGGGPHAPGRRRIDDVVRSRGTGRPTGAGPS